MKYPQVLPNDFQSSLLLLYESTTVQGKTKPSKWFINDFPSSVQLYISAVTLFWYFVLPFKKVPSGISTARPQFRDESEIQMTLDISERSVNLRSKFSCSHF